MNGVTLDRFRGYKNAAAKLLYRWKRNDVTERIAEVYRKSGSFFADSDHKNFFAEFIKNNPYSGGRSYAAVFLLSADFNLRKRSEAAIINSTVDFRKIDLKGISSDGYTLYKAAKTVYTQNPEITLEELFDKDLADDLILYIIFNGFLIAENGIKILEMEVTE
ncbi:MAG: hypothetical protein K2G04_05145 [Oscillospiraceae bacterium]|nr:hypothetical protein [Oscillospiraceae bacterium]